MYYRIRSVLLYTTLPTFIIFFSYTAVRHYSKNDDTNIIPLDVRMKNYVDLKYKMLENNEYRVATNRKIMSHKGK